MPLIKLLRPTQWAKNGILFIALVFSRKVFDAPSVWSSLTAFAAFCLVASGVYAFNDVIDAEHDRGHPKNKKRPVASGAISPLTAIMLALALWAAGILIALRLPSGFLAVIMLYVANSVSYCLLLKRLVILDVLSIVTGFFLRVVGGAAAIGVGISHWLVICTISFSLFLSFCKRRAEMFRGEDYKEVLGLYSKALIEQMISISAGLAIMSYMLYAISAETISKFHSDRLIFTVPFVVYGVFRYLYLAYKERGGENPAHSITRDPALLACGALYLAVVFWIIFPY